MLKCALAAMIRYTYILDIAIRSARRHALLPALVQEACIIATNAHAKWEHAGAVDAIDGGLV